MKKLKFLIFYHLGQYWMKNYFRAIDALSTNIEDWYEKIILAESLCPRIKEYRQKGKNWAEKARDCRN